MFAPYLLVFAILATSRCQSGFSQYIRDQWQDSDDGSRSYEPYESFLGADTWPESSAGVMGVVTVVANVTEPPHMRTQDSKEASAESAVWKITVVVAVLLVTVVGSMSMAYYLCFWRGGRFFYQPQKEDDA